MRSAFVPFSFLNETPERPSGLTTQLGVAGPRPELWSRAPGAPSLTAEVFALLALEPEFYFHPQTEFLGRENPIPGL